jgi:hypothetical protein
MFFRGQSGVVVNASANGCGGSDWDIRRHGSFQPQSLRFNQVFDTPVALQDPSLQGLAGVVSPER